MPLCRFFFDGKLGDTDGTVTVWAPTAQAMELLKFEAPEGGEAEVFQMQRGPKGTWTLPRPSNWDKHFYVLRCDLSELANSSLCQTCLWCQVHPSATGQQSGTHCLHMHTRGEPALLTVLACFCFERAVESRETK